MKHFVRYLYAYKNGKCVQNVGFVKCEESEDRAVLQIYGKGFPVNGDDMFELFLFYPEGDKCIGISMGTLKNTSPVFSYRLEYDACDVGGRETFDRVGGMILTKGQGGGKNWYAAKWEEIPLNIEQMIRKEEPMEEGPQEEVAEEPEEEELQEEVAKEPKEEEPQEEPAEEPEEEEMREEPQEEALHAAESVRVEVPSDRKQKDLIYKITREDLARLPRCEWKLANNHFLLHGYRNYHHLVSFEKDGACWLGVPGVFHPNEQKVARSFGFDQFMRPDEGEIELPAEEREEDDEFGYWCRTVSTVIGE